MTSEDATPTPGQLTLEVYTTPGRPIVSATKFEGPGDIPMWSPSSASLIYGEHDAVLVDVPATFEQTDALADWVESKGRRLVHAEPETRALRGWLDERAETGWISSVLVEIESFRALARYAPEAVSRLPAVLDQIGLIDPDPRIRVLVQAVKPVTVRSLDAIHLGTALYSRSELTSFVTYDKRLLDAARAAGLPVDSPV